MVNATIDVYNRIAEDLLPIPAKSHYTFNLRDVSKVVQGILMIRPGACSDAVTMIRLWAHECMRVFHDRLIDDVDQRYFKELLLELIQVRITRRAHRYFPVHRAGVNTAHLSSRASSRRAGTTTRPSWRATLSSATT